MPITKRKIEHTFLVCAKCGHEWEKRFEELPAVCPECKSRLWNAGEVPA
jgi:DNA-directed RNA polymerase subunit RPC12/RpoP